MKLYPYTKKEIFHLILQKTHDISLKFRQERPFWEKHSMLRRVRMIFAFIEEMIGNRRKYLSLITGECLCVNYTEIVITTYCSLHCRCCANLIQYYKCPYHIPVEELKRSIHKLTDTVDYINKIRILGGEPLLHPDLNIIVNDLCKRKNVDMVEIVTNGTIVPKSQALKKALQNKKVILQISDYGENSGHMRELINYCKKNGIHMQMALAEPIWNDYGGIQCRNRTRKELEQQFSRCTAYCYSLLHGRIHRCPRSSNGEDLKLFQCSPEEYVDLFADITKDELKKRIYNYIYHGPEKITACNYCDNGTNNMNKVSPGEQ